MPTHGPRRLPYDAHVHTTNSDGHNPLASCVRAAEAVGLSCVAITDHYWGGEPLAEWVKAIAQADAASPVTVVPGVEAVISDASGRVSIDREQGQLVRWVLADFGARTEGIGINPPATIEGFLHNVETAMCGAARNPVVDAIAHPFNLGRFPARANPEDLPRDLLVRVADTMAANGCSYEIMNQAFWWHPDLSVVEYVAQIVPVLHVFADAGVNFVVGSDAHSCGAVGNLGFCKRLMDAAGLGMEHLIDLQELNDRRRREQARGQRLA